VAGRAKPAPSALQEPRQSQEASGGALPEAAGRPDWFFRVLEAASNQRSRGPDLVDVATNQPIPADGDVATEAMPSARLVLVVDGLDEAAADPASLFGLPASLPAGVYVIASRRTGDANLPVSRPRLFLTLDQDSEENRDDMRERLEKLAAEPEMANRLRHADRSADWFVRALLDACRGLWIYLRYVIAELRGGYRTINDLDALPADLPEYYEQALTSDRDTDSPHQWYRQTLPLLAALAAAAEPQTAGRLLEFAGLDPDPRLTRRLDGSWRPILGG
jgi:hypothetical protein